MFELLPQLQEYDPAGDVAAYQHYYDEQNGNGVVVYKGSKTQAGYGIGSFFSALLRRSAPLLKNVGRRALGATLGLASDALDGKSFGQSASNRAHNMGSDFLGDVRAGILGTPGHEPATPLAKVTTYNESKNFSGTRKRRKNRQAGNGYETGQDVFS